METTINISQTDIVNFSNRLVKDLQLDDGYTNQSDTYDYTETFIQLQEHEEMHAEWNHFRGCIVLLITSGIILSNVINLKIWCSYTRMPWATRYFLINLSSSDLLVGLVATSSAIYPAFTSRWPYGAVWCQVSGITHSMSVTLSIWSIAMVGIDRYIATVKPYTYKQIMSKTRSRWMIFGMWIAAAMTYVAPLFTKSNFIYYKYSEEEYMCGLYWEYPAFCVITGTYIPVLSAGVLVFTSCKIHRSLTLSGSQKNQPNKQQINKHRSKINRRALMILKATSICFFICWGPYVVLTIWRKIQPSLSLPDWAMFSILWAANVNSMVNVFIYSFTNKHFQKEAQVMFSFINRRRKVSEDSISDENDVTTHNDSRSRSTISNNHEPLLNQPLSNQNAGSQPRDHSSESDNELAYPIDNSNTCQDVESCQMMMQTSDV